MYKSVHLGRNCSEDNFQDFFIYGSFILTSVLLNNCNKFICAVHTSAIEGFEHSPSVSFTKSFRFSSKQLILS